MTIYKWIERISFFSTEWLFAQDISKMKQNDSVIYKIDLVDGSDKYVYVRKIARKIPAGMLCTKPKMLTRKKIHVLNEQSIRPKKLAMGKIMLA
jgi:hypothetical protein